jgi:hypothetical protein
MLPARPSGGGSGVVMPSNDPGDALASVYDRILEGVRKKMSPFAETAAIRLLGKADIQKERRLELADELVSALLTWAFQHKIPGDTKLMREIKKSAMALHRQLKEVNSAYKLYEANSLAGDIDASRFGTAEWLNRDLRFATPRTDIDGVLAALSGINKSAESWLLWHDSPLRSHKRSRGRPKGIGPYSELADLVVLLQRCAVTNGVRFTAYIRKSGKLKVAAGSLIDTLNTLRSQLADMPDWKWLIGSLPLRWQHRAYVSTYRRLLKSIEEWANPDMKNRRN